MHHCLTCLFSRCLFANYVNQFPGEMSVFQLFLGTLNYPMFGIFFGHFPGGLLENVAAIGHFAYLLPFYFTLNALILGQRQEAEWIMRSALLKSVVLSGL